MSRLPIVPLPTQPTGNAGQAAASGLCQTAQADSLPLRVEPSVYGEKGFGGNVLMVTLGCAKNLVDSEVMLGALKKRGFRTIDEPADADLIVVNTCAFLQSAVEEGIDRILELSKYKEEGRCRRLVVAGCMVERYRDDLAKSLPEVDQFISTDELLDVGLERDTTAQTFDAARRPYFLYDESMPRIRSTAGHTSFIKVAEGCNRPCTFCIIPKIRGSFRSRAIESICTEASMLLTDGVKELNLVAQDLTAYGTDFDGNRGIRSELPQLLSTLASLRSDPYWIRLLYAYPIGVTDELIELLAAKNNLCAYLDLPLQHISHPVLKRMRRPLGERGTRELISQIIQKGPSLALRTTFVVGFPGETEEDVKSLESFVREGHFTHVGVFTYSQEPEAGSYSFPDQIEEEVKEARRQRIMEAQQGVVARRLESLVGSKQRVLIEGFHADSDLLLVGRTEWQGPETDGEVVVNQLTDEQLDDPSFDVTSLFGTFREVEITERLDYDLVGTLVE